MPVILRFEGYRFFFFSNEGDPREPVPVHVRKKEKVAKFWLDPEVCLAEAYGSTSREVRRLMRVVELNQGRIRRTWIDHFGD